MKATLLVPHIDRPKLFPLDQYAGFKLPETQNGNHWHEFADAILGKDKTQTNFDYAGPLTETVLLGTVAIRTPGQRLDWAPANLRFSNDAAADRLLRRSYRAGWEVPGV